MRFLGGLLTAAVLSLELFAADLPVHRELIVCGWDEVYILDLNEQPPAKIWSWKAADSPELPDELKPQFRTTDDCKPVDGGNNILVTSSSDGVTLIERKTRKVLFYGSAGGAHSAEMLPGGRIVVAASTSDRPLNNRLVVFDRTRSLEPLFETELTSGHGVVWDAKRQLLWAIGGRVLRTYKLVAWDTAKPSLEKADEYPLPDASGHDLMAVPETDLLSLTTLRHAWLFDREGRTFRSHPQLGSYDNVKNIHVHPTTGEIVWTQADKGFWWTGTLRFLNPASIVERPGEHLYKARWAAARRLGDSEGETHEDPLNRSRSDCCLCPKQHRSRSDNSGTVDWRRPGLPGWISPGG